MGGKNRTRKNYLYEDRLPEYPLYFRDKVEPIKPISFLEEKPINIEGVKPDYYTKNNYGEVYNNKGQKIKPCLINSGYFTYRLYTGDKVKKYKHMLAHRLVKQIFDPIDNFNEMTVNHKNMDRSDNSLDNLEYMTQAENNIEKSRNISNFGTYNKGAVFNKEQLKTIVTEIDNGTSYKRILEMIGIPDTKNNRDYIGNIKRGITYQKEAKEIRDENSTTNM